MGTSGPSTHYAVHEISIRRRVRTNMRSKDSGHHTSTIGQSLVHIPSYATCRKMPCLRHVFVLIGLTRCSVTCALWPLHCCAFYRPHWVIGHCFIVSHTSARAYVCEPSGVAVILSCNVYVYILAFLCVCVCVEEPDDVCVNILNFLTEAVASLDRNKELFDIRRHLRELHGANWTASTNIHELSFASSGVWLPLLSPGVLLVVRSVPWHKVSGLPPPC